MGGRIEFVPGKAMLRAEARRGRDGVDDLGVAAVGALVEGAARAGTKEALQGVLRDVGDVADGVQAVLAQQRRGPLLTELRGKFPQISVCFC
ncbi:hypothetical protein OG381_48380 [Streptomyces sp. NBC_00490]|uniref:hypothetical protein n=1 Tax=Streptomyces sp. NBC_00490 TaxID=2903657 RepID=UPI002E174EA3